MVEDNVVPKNVNQYFEFYPIPSIPSCLFINPYTTLNFVTSPPRIPPQNPLLRRNNAKKSVPNLLRSPARFFLRAVAGISQLRKYAA